MSRVIAVGYIGLSAVEPDGWAGFLESVGLQPVTALNVGDEDVRLFRMDDRPFRIAVLHGAEDGIAFLGLEVAGQAEFGALTANLPGVADGELAVRRGVAALFRTTDPAGTPIEVYYGPRIETTPFRSPHGVRFVTGPLGFGHAVFLVPDMDAANGFYIDQLGFRVSDTLAGRATGYFLHCNPRHHSIAYAEVPGRSGLQHIMFEMSAIDEVGAALDRAEARQDPIMAGLGRHSNDLMLSYYVRSPGPIEVEIGCDGRLIDPANWSTAQYAKASFWGHRRAAAWDRPAA